MVGRTKAGSGRLNKPKSVNDPVNNPDGELSGGRVVAAVDDGFNVTTRIRRFDRSIVWWTDDWLVWHQSISNFFFFFSNSWWSFHWPTICSDNLFRLLALIDIASARLPFSFFRIFFSDFPLPSMARLADNLPLRSVLAAAPRLRPLPRPLSPLPMESNSNEEQMRSSHNADRCSCCAFRQNRLDPPSFPFDDQSTKSLCGRIFFNWWFLSFLRNRIKSLKSPIWCASEKNDFLSFFIFGLWPNVSGSRHAITQHSTTMWQKSTDRRIYFQTKESR